MVFPKSEKFVILYIGDRAMKNLKGVLVKSMVVASIAFSSASAYAACDGSATCTGNLDRVYFSGAGDLFLRMADVDIPAGTTCTRDANYAVVPAAHPQLKTFYAMALTGFSLDNPVSIRVISNDPNCEVSYMYMDK